MVNFTFVSHKGARPEKSELVKSHVMRESQKKRREAKERYRDGSSLCEQSPARTSAARTEMLRQYQAMHQPLQPHIVPPSRAIPASQFSPIRDSAGGSAELLLLRRTSQPIEQESNQRLEARLRRDLRSSNTTDSSKRQNNGERLHSPHSPWTDSPFVSPQVQPLPVLADSSWMPETWLNRVNEVVSHYFVSFQGSAPDARSTLTYWFEQPRKSSIILLSYSLFYCAHRDLVHGIVGNDDHYFKARNLQLINAALEDPSTALADETIMTVVAMAMYENLRGSDQVITHERGLQQMFDMRGGIETFMSEDGLYIGNFALL
ncbi:hypothetical protein BU23DRAFT_562820 [Bimuria novae-zelandiae CBS 107.79]|uniref:Transcription factor domain-containing protein n=1 Tax=Bimuria novae-zelandiae CBS 107.79 TaxID=1447943 RepID=A0A6A5VRZ7_9PLEO|nr:hypothetical protein BU23DRAFT_562820 [Bimuria novae-zelandiae CBS 107.79]